MRLLLVKLSALGDVIHALPTLRALREGLGARVDWLVEEEQADLLRGHPLIDRLLVCPRRRWLRELRRGEVRGVVRELAGFLRELRAVEYGVVLDLQGLLKSALWTRLARAGRRVGLGTAREGSAWVLDERVPCDLNLHAVDRYLTAARYLGAGVDGVSFVLGLTPQDQQRADRLLWGMGRRLVALNPLTRWPSKRWGGFGRLCRLLVADGWRVVLVGADRRALEPLEGRGVLNLGGATGLRELACVLRRCRLLVSVDSGPMHLAAAVGTPVVALFGPTAPWRTGPYGEGHRVLRRELSCSPCFRRRCEDRRCLEEIEPEEVLEAVRSSS